MGITPRVIASPALVAVAASLAFASPAAADTTVIAMTGDPLTGSLSFRQDLVEIQAGDVVRFENHNANSDHAPWERNGLWGFTVAPGQAVERTMEAGTHLLVCRLHPDLMTATIRVSPQISIARRTIRRRDARGRLRSRRVVRNATVVWAVAPPAAGQSFDVERRHQGGAWQSLGSATTQTSTSFSDRPGDDWQVRVRLRGGDTTGAWSPVTSVVD